MSGLEGASAIDPIESDAWSSVRGVQFCPPSVVFQTPPPDAPMYTTFAFRGSTASAATRPDEYGDPPLICSASTTVGRGPISVHAGLDAFRSRVRMRSISFSAAPRAPDGIAVPGHARMR